MDDHRVGVLVVHFHCRATLPLRHVSLFIRDDWRQVLLPPAPVAVDVLSHVLWLLVRVLQVDVGGLLSALVRIPVLWDTPWRLARVHALSGHNAQRQVDGLAGATLKEAVVLQIHLEDVLHLEDLAHPGGTQVHFVHSLLVSVVSAVELSAGLALVSVQVGCRGASHHLVDLLAAVFLH